jgi:hypothetical protein
VIVVVGEHGEHRNCKAKHWLTSSYEEEAESFGGAQQKECVSCVEAGSSTTEEMCLRRVDICTVIRYEEHFLGWGEREKVN